MMRTIAIFLCAFAAHVNAATTINIDPAQLTLDAAGRALVCGAGPVPPTCPVCPVCPVTPPTQTGCKVMQMDWASPTRLYTASVGGFALNEVIAVEFTTGTVPTGGSLPRFSAAEYADQPLTRFAAISDKPCDFTPAANYLTSGPSNSVTVTFAIQPGASVFYGALKQATKYYFNIRNELASGNMFIDLVKPGGL